MRIALDASPLIATRTGVATFVRRLWDALEELPDGPTVVPFSMSLSSRFRRRSIGTWIPIPAGALVRGRTPGGRAMVDRILGDVAVVHGTNFIVPPSSAPQLVTVHDLSFVHEPERVPPSVRRFDRAVSRAISRGAWVHTPSEFVAAEVRARYGAQRVAVVAHAAPEHESTDEPRSAFPAILSLATTTARKQIPLLVDAFEIVAYRVPDSQLWLAGPAGDDEARVDERIRALPLRVRARVRRLGLVSDQERDRLLARASVLAYPSRYEGFGLPVLEAMAAGLPVVAANSSSLPEAAGDAAELVATGDVEALAAGLVAVLLDDGRREQMTAAGLARARSMTWAHVAAEMAALYRRVTETV